MSRRKPTPQMLADAERDLALGSAVRALIARNEVVLIERLDGAHLVSVGQRLGTEALADMDVSRLEPAARGRLLASLRTRVNTELRRYGIEVEALRFVNFALGLRTLRLLTDARAADEKGW